MPRRESGEAGPTDRNLPRPSPYPDSEMFSGLEWTSESSRYPGTGQDMHFWAWGGDDALYVVSCDGANFGLPWARGALVRATGVPPNHKVEQVSDFPGFALRDRSQRRYPSGIAAVDGCLYVAVVEYTTDGPSLLWPHFGVVGIMVSEDGGKTWQNIPDKNGTSRFLGPRFTGLQFVGFGPGYTHVPSPLGDYLYGISNDGNWESGNRIFLARVLKDQVLTRSAWEFYAGEGAGFLPSQPAWTSEEDEARPVFADPGHVSHPDMVYSPVFERYLLSVFSDRVVHWRDTPNEIAGKTWDKQTEFWVYEGPAPWGPWALVYCESPWEGPDHAPYCPRIPGKWLSRDGLSGAMLFAGDWTTTGEYYGFMTRTFRLMRR